MSPHAPVRSYFKPFRAAPFHPSPQLQISDLQSEILLSSQMWSQKTAAGLFSVALVVARESQISNFNFEISDLRVSGAPPLAGSLPCSVRTFLSWTELNSIYSRCNPKIKDLSCSIPAATARPVHLLGLIIIPSRVQHVQQMRRHALTFSGPASAADGIETLLPQPKYLNPTRRLFSRFGEMVKASVIEATE